MSTQSDMSIEQKPKLRSSQFLLAGLGLGIAANYVMWPAGIEGPGFVIWMILLVAAALWSTRNDGRHKLLVITCWGSTAILATLMVFLRDLDELIPAMMLVILSSATLVFLHVNGLTLNTARVSDLFIALFQIPTRAIIGTPLILLNLDPPPDASKKQWSGILRGLLIALPLLIVFGALFSSADVAFARLMPDLSQIFSATTIPRLMIIGFFAWVSAGLLDGISQHQSPVAPRQFRIFELGKQELAVVMSLLTIMFVVFVVLQITYLFGGRDTIEATTGLTLAEYARRGFFELITVAGLTLVVLVALGATNSSQRLFGILAAILIACVMIILASALQRFFLYIDAYGLTIQRLIALAMMFWLAFCLVLFASTVLRGRIAGFATGIVVSGLVITLLFGFINPAALVARTNVERIIGNSQTSTNREVGSPPTTQTNLDLDYLLTLGADVVPVLLTHLAQLAPLQQCRLSAELLSRWNQANSTEDANHDWRTWHAGRAAATKAVTENTALLQQISNDSRVNGGGICAQPQ
ncbi:MAG: DUF4173 domain-containing protein [Pseudomonadota bacterium]